MVVLFWYEGNYKLDFIYMNCIERGVTALLVHVIGMLELSFSLY